MEHSSVVLEKSEQALVDAAQGGDEAAFRALVEPLSRELSTYAYRMVGAYQARSEFERAASLTENLRQRTRLLERALACVQPAPKS